LGIEFSRNHNLSRECKNLSSSKYSKNHKCSYCIFVDILQYLLLLFLLLLYYIFNCNCCWNLVLQFRIKFHSKRCFKNNKISFGLIYFCLNFSGFSFSYKTIYG
jgi:hypothetical protein